MRFIHMTRSYTINSANEIISLHIKALAEIQTSIKTGINNMKACQIRNTPPFYLYSNHAVAFVSVSTEQRIQRA